jgi:hypothetical protein
MDRSLARKVVGLVAAYAVALGALLPVLAAALAPAANGRIGLAVICSPAGLGTGPASPTHLPIAPVPLCPACAGCAMAGCITIAPGPDSPFVVRAAAINSARVTPSLADGQPQRPRLAGINLARAPPRAV